jgi:hypothetical protein
LPANTALKPSGRAVDATAMAAPLARACAIALTAVVLAAAGAPVAARADAPGTARAGAPGSARTGAPPVFATAQWTLRVSTGAPAAFIVQAVDPDGDAVTLAWAFDDGTAAAGPAVTKVWTTPGVHTARVTATDATGLHAVHDFKILVLPAAAAAPGAPPAAVHMPRPGPAPVARASASTTALRLSAAGSIGVRVACAPGAACAGTVSIARGGRRLAAAPYAVPAGHSRTVRLRVPAVTARALRRRGRAVAIVVTLAPANGPAVRATATLRLH